MSEGLLAPGRVWSFFFQLFLFFLVFSVDEHTKKPFVFIMFLTAATGPMLSHWWRVKKHILAHKRAQEVPRKMPKPFISNCFLHLWGVQKGVHAKQAKTGELAGGYARICARMRVDMRMYARICAALLPSPLH